MVDENSVSQCNKCEVSLSDDYYSFNDQKFCKKCYFVSGKLGPMHEQYKPCKGCGETVHIFSIKCSSCGILVHETGTIRSETPIKSAVILAYAIISVILLVTSLTIPLYSSLGFVAWVISIVGFLISLHGLLGFLFWFLPFGFVTIKRFTAFSIGTVELLLGVFLVILPKIIN
jgi:hypothetical protein